MTLFDHYITTIEYIKDIHAPIIKVINKNVHEFYEGSIPLFHLIYGVSKLNKAQQDRIYISFHLSLNSVDAIQWFIRVRKISSKIFLLSCNYADNDGYTFLGQDAEILRYQKEEQAILDNWIKQTKDAKNKIFPIAYVDSAIQQFEESVLKKDTKCH